MSASTVRAGVAPARRGACPLGTLILFGLVALGAVAAVLRYSQGLGATTNLRDDVSWGLWIGLDVMGGVALAGGGFTMAAIVYIFRVKRFYPLARPAILTAFVGYILAAGSILFDLGRPERFYYFLIFRNVHSIMFEVAMSVFSYLIVLTIENSQWVAERIRWKWWLGVLRRILLVFVVLGIIISTLHQSSLGALFLMSPHRLPAVWYTPILPILFYVSAIMVGMAMVIVESLLSASAFRRKPEMHLLSELGGWLRYALGFYLLLKAADIVIGGDVARLFTSGTASFFFWLEVAFGVIVPLILLSSPRVRQDRVLLFRSALLVALGVLLNRFNVLFFGMGGVFYAPSWVEFAVSAGLTSLGILMYMFAAKYFPVLDQHPH